MNTTLKYLLLFLLLSVCFFHALLFTSGDIAGNYGDIYLHSYPLKYLTSEFIIAGKLPLWNPYIFAGQPLLANPQAAVFYPFTLIFYFFGLPVAFNYFIVIHFVLAGLFMYLLLRFYTRSHMASTAGAFIFAYSTFLVYKVPAGQPVALSGYIWFPLVMLCIESMGRENRWAAFILSGALALQFLSGHVHPIYISFIFIAAHFISKRFVYWKELLLAGAGALLLSGVQFLPTLELSRVAETALWHKVASNYSLPIGNLITVLFPNYFGNIPAGDYIFPGNPDYFFERHALYIGLIPIFLALAGLYFAAKGKKLFWPMLILFGLFLSIGYTTPIYRWLYWMLPGLRFIRVPSRFIFLSITGLIIMASFAWDRYFKHARKTVHGIVFMLIVLDLFLWGHRFIFVQDVSFMKKKNDLSKYITPLYRVITEPETISPNKSMLYHHFNVNGYETILLQDFTRYLGLQEKEVLSTNGLARTNLHTPLVQGYSPKYYITTSYFARWKKIASLPNNLAIYNNPDALPFAFFAKTIREVPEESGYDQIEHLRHTGFTPMEEIVVNTLPEGYSNLSQGGRVASYKNTGNTVSIAAVVDGPSALVCSEFMYPGWRAYTRGTRLPLYRGNKVFRTLFVQKGDYQNDGKIVMVFMPPSFRLGLFCTLLALLIVCYYAFRGFQSLILTNYFINNRI